MTTDVTFPVFVPLICRSGPMPDEILVSFVTTGATGVTSSLNFGWPAA